MAREIRRSATPSPDRLDATGQATVLGRLRRAHSRLTTQRSIAAQLIAAKARAFTTAMLVEELRPLGVSRSTVYRTLKLLDRLEALARVTLDGQPGYVVCDAAGHHYHLTCGQCFSVLHVDSAALGSQVDHAAREQRQFSVRARLVEVGGRCSACRDAGA